MSVLSQALCSASHSNKLEFMVRNAEELSVVMEELKACDGGTTLQHSVSRLYTFFNRLIWLVFYDFAYNNTTMDLK